MRTASSGAAALVVAAQLFCLLQLTTTAPASAAEFLDPATGEIDGRAALAIYPAIYEGREPSEFLDPENCTVKLKDPYSFEVHARPCAEWFLVPPGPYDYWIEKDWMISPFAGKLIVGAGEFQGRGMSTAIHLDAAGRVSLPSDFELGSRFQLRVLHAETPVVDRTLLRRSISHRIELGSEDSSALLPVGSTLASVWDDERQRYVMLSRPFAVAERETVEAPIEEAPVERAHLVAQTVRHTICHTTDEDTLRMVLVRDGVEVAPDLTVPGAGTVYGIWYDLEPGTFALKAEASGAAMSPVPVDLSPGEIGRAIGRMEGTDSPAKKLPLFGNGLDDVLGTD